MGTADFFKSAVDSLDKVTDILNVGRLIFYTAAGFCVLLPWDMTLRMLADKPADLYWNRFLTDLGNGSASWRLWLAALIVGFVIANIANMLVISRFVPPPPRQPRPDSYAFAYPRLFSGGVRPKDGAVKDYAAWLISEYYRYLEIAVFIPYSIALSLPVYSLYSLLFLFRAAGHAPPTVPNAGHFAFAFWALLTIFVWGFLWPHFWLPRIAQPLYRGWVDARRAAIDGLQDFINDPKLSPKSGDAQPSQK